MPSVILNHTILKGQLNDKDSVSIDGAFIGDIKAEEIIVKDLGNINGNLNANTNIEVNGEVIGDLSSDKIHLTSSAKVRGKLSHKNFPLNPIKSPKENPAVDGADFYKNAVFKMIK